MSKSEECFRKRADRLACRQSDKEDAVTIVKTELSDMEDHRKAVQEDIARRAYALCMKLMTSKMGSNWITGFGPSES